eukprot:s1185_g9.t1
MGRDRFDLVYTDTSPNAAWRNTLYYQSPYDDMPELARLRGYTDRFITSDLMHNWHLGCLRDLLGSVIKVLCKSKAYFSGSTIPKRLKTLYREAKDFAKQNNKQLSLKGLKKTNLMWASDRCPELKCSASDALVFHMYLSHKLQQKPPPKYPGMTVTVWAAQSFISCMMYGSLFLSEEERYHIHATGRLFFNCYVKLANEAAVQKEFLFKCRPKLHYMMHTVDETLLKPSARNPAFDAVFMDEDYVKWSMRMAKKMSSRTTSLNMLKRFRVVTRSMLLKLVSNS